MDKIIHVDLKAGCTITSAQQQINIEAKACGWIAPEASYRLMNTDIRGLKLINKIDNRIVVKVVGETEIIEALYARHYIPSPPCRLHITR